jgi:hypothetical protein
MRADVRLAAVGALWVASVLLCVGLGFGAGRWSVVESTPQYVPGRTYYESLDLSSPEEAVQELCAAFRTRDYATVYLVLAPQAQSIIQQNISLLRWGHLVREEAADDVMQELCVISEGIGGCDYEGEQMLWFDDLMLGAKKRSAFLIDLSGTERITGRRSATTGEGLSAIDVIATVRGISGEVVFRTVQVPASGKWRVLQVIVPGGNEELIPWSVPGVE